MEQSERSRPWASFHGVHTSFSGGAGTVAETAQMAMAAAFARLAFAVRGWLHANMQGSHA